MTSHSHILGTGSAGRHDPQRSQRGLQLRSSGPVMVNEAGACMIDTSPNVTIPTSITVSPHPHVTAAGYLTTALEMCLVKKSLGTPPSMGDDLRADQPETTLETSAEPKRGQRAEWGAIPWQTFVSAPLLGNGVRPPLVDCRGLLLSGTKVGAVNSSPAQRSSVVVTSNCSTETTGTH